MDLTTHPGPTVRLPAGDLIDLAEVTSALERCIADADSGVAVVDLTTGGPKRCIPSAGTSDVARWERALHRLETLPIPTVALLSGRLSGASLEVAVACDLRIATPDGILVWTNDGAIWPATVLYRLTQLIGAGRVQRLVLLARELPVSEAQAMGLVDIVTAELGPQLTRSCQKLMELDDVRVTRQLVHEAAHSGYDEALGAHLAACDRYLRQKGLA